jgi:hypothetical protein
MRSLVAIAGLVLIAFIHLMKRRERDKERQAANLRHITGAKHWWCDPPPKGEDF